MLKDTTLAAPIPGSARVMANGHLSVVLPLVDGTVATYAATPVTSWYFTRETPSSAREGAWRHCRRCEGVVAFRTRQAHLDAALNILAAIERRVTDLDFHHSPSPPIKATRLPASSREGAVFSTATEVPKKRRIEHEQQ